MERLGWPKYFEAVVGSREGGSGAAKPDLIRTVLERAALNAGQRAVMVGDHPNEIKGAAANYIDSIAVTYGYGEPVKLKDSQPTHIADSIQSLRGMLARSHV